MSAIEVRDLTRRFGSFTAVDALSFEVSEGEVFGFLGPNGAGKTTTIKMLTGLLRPTSGAARVAGLDVAADPAAVRARIGYMSQLFSLYGDLTVGENISLFAGLYGVRGERLRERRDWALDMAELGGRESEMTALLPLGYKQRLALGCAVLHEPQLLFLDEPTSGVDPSARRGFWSLIRDLAAADTTVLVSTHYMEEAENCDRVLLMNRGRRVALDAPTALRRAFQWPILEVRTDDTPRAADLLATQPGVRDAAMFGRSVHVVLDQVDDSGIAGPGAGASDALDAAAARVRASLETSGLTVEGVRRIPPALEDVFVALVKDAGGVVAG